MFRGHHVELGRAALPHLEDAELARPRVAGGDDHWRAGQRLFRQSGTQVEILLRAGDVADGRGVDTAAYPLRDHDLVRPAQGDFLVQLQGAVDTVVDIRGGAPHVERGQLGVRTVDRSGASSDVTEHVRHRPHGQGRHGQTAAVVGPYRPCREPCQRRSGDLDVAVIVESEGERRRRPRCRLCVRPARPIQHLTRHHVEAAAGALRGRYARRADRREHEIPRRRLAPVDLRKADVIGDVGSHARSRDADLEPEVDLRGARARPGDGGVITLRIDSASSDATGDVRGHDGDRRPAAVTGDKL